MDWVTVRLSNELIDLLPVAIIYFSVVGACMLYWLKKR